jgi:hypothetical protein
MRGDNQRGGVPAGVSNDPPNRSVVVSQCPEVEGRESNPRKMPAACRGGLTFPQCAFDRARALSRSPGRDYLNVKTYKRGS